MRASFYALVAAAALPIAHGQFPAQAPGVTVVKSKVDPKVTISFKETKVCERNDGVKAYSGFVHMPGSILTDVGGFDINSFFLYFEARKNPATAPLALYLAGGPGESSTYSAFASEGGPCYVNSEGTDTINNPWSLNNQVNMLYIDQPVDAGFSYSSLINGTFNLLAGDGLITPIDFDPSNPPPVNASFGYGTFPDQQFNTTQKTTVQAAKSLWHFAEHWMSSFPGYSTSSNQVSLWGNSYGGFWVPETAVRFREGLATLPSGHPLECKNLKVDAIGITNGCIDLVSSGLGWPDYAYNNTYDIQFASDAEYDQAVQNFTGPGGCRDLIDQCRAAGQQDDPEFTGNNPNVNELCMEAYNYCVNNVIGGFPEINEHSAFDIAVPYPLPCDFWLPVQWYLNKAETQAALGVSFNYTYDSNVVVQNYGLNNPYTPMFPLNASTGDFVRQNGVPNLERLLADGVKVAFIYGDRDYRCPWNGAESLALGLNWAGQSKFADAGYGVLQGMETPVDQGGLTALVKQHGKFSFSRVMGSGHPVNAYGPETVYRIFERTIKGSDVVTGAHVADDTYSSPGPKDSWGWRNELPAKTPDTCILEGVFSSTNPWINVPGSSVDSASS